VRVDDIDEVDLRGHDCVDGFVGSRSLVRSRRRLCGTRRRWSSACGLGWWSGWCMCYKKTLN